MHLQRGTRKDSQSLQRGRWNGLYNQLVSKEIKREREINSTKGRQLGVDAKTVDKRKDGSKTRS